MATHRNREEAVNTQLAILISRYGITADGETIHVHGKHRPDVLFELRGLRVVIEENLPTLLKLATSFSMTPGARGAGGQGKDRLQRHDRDRPWPDRQIDRQPIQRVETRH
jgi:hypothetical protein